MQVGDTKLTFTMSTYPPTLGYYQVVANVSGTLVFPLYSNGLLCVASKGNACSLNWNGPAGVFEFDNFIGGSYAIAEAIAKATANGAFSLVGGGDSVACVNKFNMADKVSYISTGGGALLEAIEGKVLPGVAAIKGE